MPTTTAMLLTPAGRGAVASIRIAGPDAERIVERHFRAASRRALADHPAGRVVFGRWGSPPGEEIVACRSAEGVVELHCHGGQAASRQILDDLAGAGCGVVPWTALDEARLLESEALVALTQSRTERTASLLLDQYRGALARECGLLHDLVLAGKLEQTLKRLESLLGRSALGLHLASPWKLVLAGRPNVGKSSLINAILGYQRAIVFDQPGTTRDAVKAATALAGWPVELTDTAGLRSTIDPLERAGIDRTVLQAAEADCLVLVFDASQAWSEHDRQLLANYPVALVVHNKADRAVADDRPSGISTTATQGEGIAELMAAVAERLVPLVPPPMSAIPFTPRQIAWLLAAKQAATTGDQSRTAACLESLFSSRQLPRAELA